MDLLTINKRDINADDDQGPNVNSEDRDERIEARRIRIQKKKDLAEQYKKKILKDLYLRGLDLKMLIFRLLLNILDGI